MTDAKYVKKAPRQSNLELSRILAMYLIVMHHFSVHGGVSIWSGSAPLSFNFYLDQLLSTGGKIGVNLFVLITGYFLAKKFSKFSSLVYLWIKTFSYVIIFFLLFCALGLHPFSWSSLVSCFFPIRGFCAYGGGRGSGHFAGKGAGLSRKRRLYSIFIESLYGPGKFCLSSLYILRLKLNQDIDERRAYYVISQG